MRNEEERRNIQENTTTTVFVQFRCQSFTHLHRCESSSDTKNEWKDLERPQELWKLTFFFAKSKMEAKNSGNVTEAGVAVAPNKNLVIRFVEYAFDVLNNRMDEFFEDSMNSFDQDLSELRDGSGETLEQYEIYQKYLKLLELKFDEFATDEGYESSTQCFDEINDLICNDEIERKKIFKEMSERMMAAFQNFQQQIQDGAEAGAGEDDGKKGEKGEEEEDVKSEKKSSDAKGSGRKIKDSKESKGDDEADDEADAKGTSHQQVQDTAHAQASPAPPVMMFFQPVSLDSMLQHVLSLTEYTTFSTIIRTKLKQKQLFMSLQDRVSSQSKNTSKRQRSLEHNEHFEEIYEELIQRICDFAPNQTNFQNQIRSHLNLKSWKELLAAGKSLSLFDIIV
jgi:hypothetical protein